ARKIFIRPSYYYSNWLNFLETVQLYGIMPTFFPDALKFHMLSPIDLGKFIATIMVDNANLGSRTIFELTGPEMYNSSDVARTFSQLLGKDVVPQTIPEEEWTKTFLSAGFTENTSQNLSDMTRAV